MTIENLILLYILEEKQRVFSGLISLLDHRMLTGHRGCMINLSDSVIIIVSDLGNGDFIVAMFEQASERERNLNALMDRREVIIGNNLITVFGQNM